MTNHLESLEHQLRSGTPVRNIALPNLLRVLGIVSVTEPAVVVTRVQLMCNWLPSAQLRQLWNKMTPNHDYIWTSLDTEPGQATRTLELVTSDPDVFVVVNAPLSDEESRTIDPSRTIVMQMEPRMAERPELWREWANPDPTKFLAVVTHAKYWNPIEWHLGLSYAQLIDTHPEKTHDTQVSAIVSAKYYDEGHRKRIDFIKATEHMLQWHVYGNNAFVYRNYCGPLPYHQKDAGLLPFRYTFTAENHSIPNYVTEKLVDAILAECLCFYWGCPNVDALIDPQCYILLPLDDIPTSLAIVQRAIADDVYTARLPAIRAMKTRILTELQCMPFLERIIHNIQHQHD